ncbi:hypothetical protein HGM15179_002588, partial [Zosterops borbonicus]
TVTPPASCWEILGSLRSLPILSMPNTSAETKPQAGATRGQQCVHNPCQNPQSQGGYHPAPRGSLLKTLISCQDQTQKYLEFR